LANRADFLKSFKFFVGNQTLIFYKTLLQKKSSNSKIFSRSIRPHNQCAVENGLRCIVGSSFYLLKSVIYLLELPNDLPCLPWIENNSGILAQNVNEQFTFRKRFLLKMFPLFVLK
jgi:hypothetical protein